MRGLRGLSSGVRVLWRRSLADRKCYRRLSRSGGAVLPSPVRSPGIAPVLTGLRRLQGPLASSPGVSVRARLQHADRNRGDRRARRSCRIRRSAFSGRKLRPGDRQRGGHRPRGRYVLPVRASHTERSPGAGRSNREARRSGRAQRKLRHSLSASALRRHAWVLHAGMPDPASLLFEHDRASHRARNGCVLSRLRVLRRARAIPFYGSWASTVLRVLDRRSLTWAPGAGFDRRPAAWRTARRGEVKPNAR